MNTENNNHDTRLNLIYVNKQCSSDLETQLSTFQ